MNGYLHWDLFLWYRDVLSRLFWPRRSDPPFCPGTEWQDVGQNGGTERRINIRLIIGELVGRVAAQARNNSWEVTIKLGLF